MFLQVPEKYVMFVMEKVTMKSATHEVLKNVKLVR